MRTFPIRPLLFLLLTLLVAAPAFARSDDGGSDAGHSGGDGTFLRCEAKGSKHVFYSFWDLGSTCPYQQEERGDQIWLSPQETRAGGAWIDTRLTKSYRYLEKVAKDWSFYAPDFSAWLRKSLRQPMNFIITPYSIQSILEIQVAPGYDDGEAVPGAYFDFASERLFVDLKIWNQAGLKSQAAMLLHEHLRRAQARLQLKNYQIQRIVRRAIDWAPPNDKGALLYSDNQWETCYLINDDLFAHALPGQTPRPSRDLSQPVSQEIADARSSGILGDAPVVVNPHTNGSFGVEERKPDPHHEIDVLGTCVDGTPDEDY